MSGRSSVKYGSFSIYPNPLKGEVYIDRSTETSRASCKIYDLKGHLIRESKNLLIKNTISFSAFPSGMYTIKVQDENEIIIRNFLKL